MELEFDKEMDAILRKARGGQSAAVTAAASPHLDADAVAAFVENALPQKAKLLYMEHFADCDRCRRMLSQAMLMNTEAVATAASDVSAPVAETAMPWYGKLFRTPNLALAMGALVLAFSGVLGYLVMQNRNADLGASVSQVNEPEAPRGGPFDSGAAANAAQPFDTGVANKPMNAANTAANSSMMASNTAAVNAPGTTVGRFSANGGSAAAPETRTFTTDGVSAGVPATSDAVPAPMVAVKPVADKDDKLAVGELAKEETRAALTEKKKVVDESSRRDLPPAPAKSGPARSGPLSNQSNQINTQTFEMNVKRNVGGKTFENRNGVWYDSAYNGQSVTTVRRSSDDYKKLDSGLRGIANTLGGTVVLVWKDKAYRIQ